jgi:hypothetical protein
LERGVEGLRGYRRAYDWRISGGAKKKAYERVCQFVQEATGQKICVAYNPVNAWMPAVMVTIAPPDRTGMRRAPLEEILGLLPGFRFSHVEVAHDFSADSVVDADFVGRHRISGKSRRTDDPAHPDIIYFGARRSPVFTRCYWKKEIDCYRIEVDHSEWLKKHRIATTDDFVKLWALDRLSRSLKDLIEALDEFGRLGIEFVCLRQNLSHKHQRRPPVVPYRRQRGRVRTRSSASQGNCTALHSLVSLLQIVRFSLQMDYFRVARNPCPSLFWIG